MPAAKKQDKPRNVEIKNSKAFHKYHVGEKFEAGIVLQGTEVKSIRAGKAQINEAFIRFMKGEPYIFHAHIDEYKFGSDANHNPVRPRKLLLHKREINKLKAALETKGQTIIPIKIYFKQALVKVQIALCTGKKLFDKREDMKKRTDMREAERAMKYRR